MLNYREGVHTKKQQQHMFKKESLLFHSSLSICNFRFVLNLDVGKLRDSNFEKGVNGDYIYICISYMISVYK